MMKKLTEIQRFQALNWWKILTNVSILGADDDDTILKAFDAFEVNGKIDAEM